MNKTLEKIIGGIIVVSILTTSIIFYPRTVRAQSTDPVKACSVDTAVDFLGGKLIEGIEFIAKAAIGAGLKLLGIPSIPGLEGPQKVEEVGKQKREVQKLTLRTCLNAIKEKAFREALARFKKRLLDRITDDTIAWINGETDGAPKFVTDFDRLIEDVTQATIGDVALEVGLGDLCTGIQPLRIRVQLERPIFSQRVSCTLDDIVGNIERFGRNFTSGGFIGYQELLKPANNRWGVEILTQAEVERRARRTQAAKEQEVISSQGFLSLRQCLEWTPYATDARGKTVPTNDPISVNEHFNYPDPTKPPPTLDNTQEWKCTKQRITTPGGTIATALDKAFTQDADYIVNSDDLSPYIAAIFDAAINRLIKAGVSGLSGIAKSESVSGRAPKVYAAGDRYATYGREYESSTNFDKALGSSITQKIGEIKTNLNLIETLINEVSKLNENLMTSLSELSMCESSRLGNACDGTNKDIENSKSIASELTEKLNTLSKIRIDINKIQTLVDGGASGDSLESLSATISVIESDVERLKDSLEILKDNIIRKTDLVADQLQSCQNTSITYECPSPSP